MACRITRGNAKVLGPHIEALVEAEKGRKASKYKNIHTLYGGVTYASRAEAAYAAQLDLAVAAGAVKWWVRQVAFVLGPDHRVIVDFLVVPDHGDVYCVDVKGVWTHTFRKNKRMWLKYGRCDMWVVMKGETEIVPGGLAK